MAHKSQTDNKASAGCHGQHHLTNACTASEVAGANSRTMRSSSVCWLSASFLMLAVACGGAARAGVILSVVLEYGKTHVPLGTMAWKGGQAVSLLRCGEASLPLDNVARGGDEVEATASGTWKGEHWTRS